MKRSRAVAFAAIGAALGVAGIVGCTDDSNVGNNPEGHPGAILAQSAGGGADSATEAAAEAPYDAGPETSVTPPPDGAAQSPTDSGSDARVGDGNDAGASMQDAGGADAADANSAIHDASPDHDAG